MVWGFNIYPIPFFITPDGKGGNWIEEGQHNVYGYTEWMEYLTDRFDKRQYLIDQFVGKN